MNAPTILLALVLVGCASGAAHEKLLLESRTGMQGLEVGMTQSEVVALMPRSRFHVREAGNSSPLAIDNPYRQIALGAEDGTEVDVLYYYTRLALADGIASNEELTPLAFEDGRLVGWGWEFLEQRYGERTLQRAAAAEIQAELDGEQAAPVLLVPDPTEEMFYRTLHGLDP